MAFPIRDSATDNERRASQGANKEPIVPIKKNDSRYGDALACEAEGLALLREAITMASVEGVRVPDVFWSMNVSSV